MNPPETLGLWDLRPVSGAVRPFHARSLLLSTACIRLSLALGEAGEAGCSGTSLGITDLTA